MIFVKFPSDSSPNHFALNTSTYLNLFYPFQYYTSNQIISYRSLLEQKIISDEAEFLAYAQTENIRAWHPVHERFEPSYIFKAPWEYTIAVGNKAHLHLYAKGESFSIFPPERYFIYPNNPFALRDSNHGRSELFCYQIFQDSKDSHPQLVCNPKLFMSVKKEHV
jgi:hypothetical protein